MEKCKMCDMTINQSLSCNHNFCPKCISELDNVCPECIGKLDYVIVKRNKMNIDRFYLFYDCMFCCGLTSTIVVISGIILYNL